MKIKKGHTLIIEFKEKMPMLSSGEFRVENIVSKNTMLVSTKKGSNILLDIREHGKSFRIQSVK